VYRRGYAILICHDSGRAEAEDAQKRVRTGTEVM